MYAQVVALVESLLARLRFIPQPEAQERYLAGAVGAVLQQAHGRILRMLQQADVFKDLTGYAWLPRVRYSQITGAAQHFCRQFAAIDMSLLSMLHVFTKPAIPSCSDQALQV